MAEKPKFQFPKDQDLTAEIAKMRKNIQIQFQEISRAMEKFLANMDEASNVLSRERKEAPRGNERDIGRERFRSPFDRNQFNFNKQLENPKERDREREREREKEREREREKERERQRERERLRDSRSARPRDTLETKISEKRDRSSASSPPVACPRFYLKRDLRPYKPEEVKVKIEANGVSIHAKHVEKGQKGTAASEYVEQIGYPKGIDGSKVTSRITPEGILIIEAVNDKNGKQRNK